MNFKIVLFCIAASVITFNLKVYSKIPFYAGRYEKEISVSSQPDKRTRKNELLAPTQVGFMSWYIKTYKDTVKKDTSFFINGKDKVEIKLSYYCTYDNKIILTGDYLKILDAKGHLLKAPNKFITHNFVSDVKVKLNSKPIYSNTVKKEDFASLGLADDLKQAGVLAYQGISKYSRGFTIYYRIGIPTNEYRGVVCTLDFDSTGHSSFKLHE